MRLAVSLTAENHGLDETQVGWSCATPWVVDSDGVSQPAPAPRFSSTLSAIQRPPAKPGQHTEEALRDRVSPLMNCRACAPLERLGRLKTAHIEWTWSSVATRRKKAGGPKPARTKRRVSRYLSL